MKWKVTDIATIEVYGKDRRRDKIIQRNMREEFQELGDAYMFKEKRLCGHLFKSPNILSCQNRFSSLNKARRGNTELRTMAKTGEEAKV